MRPSLSPHLGFCEPGAEPSEEWRETGSPNAAHAERHLGQGFMAYLFEFRVLFFGFGILGFVFRGSRFRDDFGTEYSAVKPRRLCTQHPKWHDRFRFLFHNFTVQPHVFTLNLKPIPYSLLFTYIILHLKP